MPNNDLPALLHHYTSMASLAGIINYSMLWATSVTELNDATEMQVVKDDLITALHQKAGDTPPLPPDQLWEGGRHQAGLSQNYAATATWLAGDPERACFVTCFSGLADDFGMWKKFGAEVSISFRPGALADLQPREPIAEHQGEPIGGSGYLNSILKEVQYLAEDDSESRRAMVEEIARAVGSASPPMELRRAALIGLASIKNAVFESDAEWRLFIDHSIYPGSPSAPFYPRVTSENKHYIELRVPLSAIERITIAPGRESGKLAHIASNIANARGMQADIRPSRVPLRFTDAD